jgi:ketosteroid isomerase-like protein
MRQLVTASLVALSLAAWTRADPVSKEKEILDADRACSHASSEKGLEGFLSCFSENATVLPGGGGPVSGKAAIRKTMAETFSKPNTRLTWEPLKAEASGDLGYSFGTFVLQTTGPDDEAREAYGKYTSVWKREKPGVWRIVVDIGNSNPPPEAK